MVNRNLNLHSYRAVGSLHNEYHVSGAPLDHMR